MPPAGIGVGSLIGGRGAHAGHREALGELPEGDAVPPIRGLGLGLGWVNSRQVMRSLGTIQEASRSDSVGISWPF